MTISGRIKRLILGAALLAGWLSFSHPVFAAGTLYLSPSSTGLSQGSEVSLGLRISPASSVNGVHAEISYDASKLQFVSADDSGTAFPDVAEQNTESNPITLTRVTANNVTSDALIITLRFRALVGGGNTTITVTGNAGQDGSASDPAAQGAVITFGTPSSGGGGSSGGTGGSRPGASTPGGSSTPGGTTPAGTDPAMPSLDDMTQTEGAAHPDDHPQEDLVKRVWWLGILPALALVLLIVWFIKRRQATLATEAKERQIDRTWALPKEEHHADPKTDELLGHAPGVANPDPGSVITPTPKDPDER